MERKISERSKKKEKIERVPCQVEFERARELLERFGLSGSAHIAKILKISEREALGLLNWIEMVEED